MKEKLLFLLFLSAFPILLSAQKQKADSLINLLMLSKKEDTSKVELLINLASSMNAYKPDSAIIYGQKALNLAIKINYTEGMANALKKLATSFRKIGNYSKALEYNLRLLKIREKQNDLDNLVTVLINIGVNYKFQQEYQNALLYNYKADSVITKFNLGDSNRYYVYTNLGDIYDRLKNNDSAFNYFNKSLIVSNNLKSDDFIGNAMTGLGHTYLEMGNYDFSKLNYISAIKYLQTANDDEVLCEAYLGLAELYHKKTALNDSAIHYAKASFTLAEKDGFLNGQLDATSLLTAIYKIDNNVDSAYVYLIKKQQLNDSLNSKEKIRQLLLMTSNENIRQLEIEESKKIAKEERKKQLQLLFIGFFIPGLFLLTLLLSRIRIQSKIIKVLGILSLLILFEYLTLFLHPTVASFTNHTPIYEMLIFVSIAAVLIPAHHRFEQWLIKKLIRNNESIKLKKIKLKKTIQ